MSRHECRLYEDGMPFKYAHLKRDGIWLTVTKSPVGLVTVETSNDKDKTQEVKHNGWFGNVVARVPVGTTLYGECWVQDEPASYVLHALAEGKPTQFDVFAIGNMKPEEPLNLLQELCVMWGLQFAPFAEASEGFKPYVENEVWNVQSVYELFLKEHGNVEGIVFKDGNRSNWFKWKPTKTIDCVVTGTVDGKGKYLGLIGSLRCSLHTPDGLEEICTCGGFDDATRAELSLNEDALVGRVVEVAYQYVASGGRLRHPRFVRMRDDKLPEQCTKCQDPDF